MLFGNILRYILSLITAHNKVRSFFLQCNTRKGLIMPKDSTPGDSARDVIARFPVWLAILLVGVLPIAVYLLSRQSVITLVVFAVGILVCLLYLVTHLARKFAHRHPSGVHDSNVGKEEPGRAKRDVWVEIYPTVILAIALAWFVTGIAWIRLPSITQSVLQGTLFALTMIVMVVLFTVAANSIGRNRPWIFTICVTIFFGATLFGYYTETLHFLLDPLGGALTTLGQQGQWAPNRFPLIVAIICLVLVGAAVVALRSGGRYSLDKLLGNLTIRSLIFFGWYIVVIYILFRAMHQAYGLMAAVLITGVLIVLGVLAIPGLVGPISKVLVRLLNLVQLVFAVIMFSPVAAARYVWTSIRNLYINHIRRWFENLELILERPADLLGDWLDTLVRMINEPDASDQFVNAPKINDAELLVRSVQRPSSS